MADSQMVPPCKLHRPFRLYDPEAVGVLMILLGLFQVVLGIPVYFITIDIPLLFICPVFVGVVQVIVGSFVTACERSSSRQLMKSCFYTSVFGLLVGLSSVIVYSYATNNVPSAEPCNTPVHDIYGETPTAMYPCIGKATTHLVKGIIALLLVYDMGALILQGFISFSALKGLKSN